MVYLIRKFLKKYKGRCNYFKTSLRNTTTYQSKKLMDVLKTLKINIKIKKNINNNLFIKKNIINKKYDLILSFGSAWIFNKKIIDAFNEKILNFHPVYLPYYMGAAHFTWQILNSEKFAGITFQFVTNELNKGDILIRKKFKINKGSRIPMDYFNNHYEITCKFLDTFSNKIFNQKSFNRISFKNYNIEKEKEFFPRLNTKLNGFINWEWNIDDIVSFCNSFDSPYPGSLTFLNKKKIYIKGVDFYKKKKYHPYCSGLVVNKIDENIIICTSGGLIKVSSIFSENGIKINNFIRLGNRLYTPRIIYEKSLLEKPNFK